MREPRDASLGLKGHAAQMAAFRSALAHGRLHHAWLITGPEGVGKAAFAFRMARILLNAEEGDSPAGRRVTAGTHADLLSVARGYDEKRQRHRAEIVADEVRPIGAFLRRTAAEGGRRAVVIDGAEWMNRNAANALLKVLEEPPTGAVLLLSCTLPGRLLPTILSRCRRLELAPLSDRDLHAVLAEEAPDASPAELARVVAQAGGSPGRAMAYLADEGGAIARAAQEAAQGMSAARALATAEMVTRRDSGFTLFFTLLGDALARKARQAARAGQPDAVAIAGAWDAIAQLRTETESFNLDKQEALLEAMTIASQT